ncbi:uncharacterized protein DFL_004747 [Arthrobotrys flagrans]|uniref:TAP42-like protein n=1 Tax=Arthrobotrys flagrans TaxID=97331 RepID=A0A437A5V0_ARTFL|nr:hypothetical protein DFL_004747 [Arthrobotrys flagrans]
MSEADPASTSLKSVWEKVERQRKELATFTDYNSVAYKAAVAEALTTISACRDAINSLSLFSNNEILEDVSTNELKYMLVDAYRGDLLLKQHDRSTRLSTLHDARTSYRSFLSLCDSYALLGPYEKKAYQLSDKISPMVFSEIHTDAAARRNAKIERYKQEKELKAKLEHLSNLTPSPNVDDEDIRSLYLSQIELAVMQSLQQLEGIYLEIDILGKAPSEEQLLEQRRGRQEEDERSRRRKADDNYSDRVDPSEIFTKANGRPLLSSDGKPLRPFTLLSNREIVKGGVFGPGHRLPTMTIEDYLEEEKRRGGIIEGGGEASGRQPEPDEDNLELADQETYKARQWDEFKEANPKGSGNTINRG